jgi:hypothetical protein
MKVNGEAIYGTSACPTRLPVWGRITTKAEDAVSTLYLHVFDWPEHDKLRVSISNEAISCHLLADTAEWNFKVTKPGVNNAAPPRCATLGQCHPHNVNAEGVPQTGGVTKRVLQPQTSQPLRYTGKFNPSIAVDPGDFSSAASHSKASPVRYATLPRRTVSAIGPE